MSSEGKRGNYSDKQKKNKYDELIG